MDTDRTERAAMSFREKVAWISVISLAGIYGAYFTAVVRTRSNQTVHVGWLLTTVIALIVVQAGLTIAVAIRNPKDAKARCDERERLIQLRSAQFAYSGLATAIAIACMFGGMTPPIVFNTNALLFILVGAELMRSGSQIVQYRTGE